jgi:ABC-type transport system involved in cytochrome bd biosynthesis fused ATPase/permease subunit
VALACLLGAGAIAADIGLMGCAAWLISRAAQHPNESVLAIAIVGVQFFGLSRGFLRYEERLVGHDAAFRVLATLRVRVYRRLEQVAPGGLPAFRRGDLLARMVRDVDSLQDVILRVIPPFTIALLVGLGTVIVMWWMLPAAGLVLALALILAATVVPWLTGVLARRREARFSHVRGELSVSVVDLIEGASELVAFGATSAQLATVRQHDTDLAGIATASAGTAGIGLALTTALSGLACWGCLVVGIPSVRSGALSGVLLAVIVLIPLAAFELVVGLPVATQALGKVRRPPGGRSGSAGAPPLRSARHQPPVGLGQLPRGEHLRPARHRSRPRARSAGGGGRAERVGQVHPGCRPAALLGHRVGPADPGRVAV